MVPCATDKNIADLSVAVDAALGTGSGIVVLLRCPHHHLVFLVAVFAPHIEALVTAAAGWAVSVAP